MNDIWLNNRVDITENFPEDYSRKYLSSFLENDDEKKLFYQWPDKFLTSFGKNPDLY